MEKLAEAMILAAQYIEERPGNATADDDVKQLETIAHVLSHCSEEEKRVLIEVAQRIGLQKWPYGMGILEQ